MFNFSKYVKGVSDTILYGLFLSPGELSLLLVLAVLMLSSSHVLYVSCMSCLWGVSADDRLSWMGQTQQIALADIWQNKFVCFF